MVESKVKNQKSKIKSTSKKSKVETKVADKKVVAKKEVKTRTEKTVKTARTAKTKVLLGGSPQDSPQVDAGVIHASMNVDVFNTEGKKTGTMELPKEVFGANVNKQLIAQAVRVYLVNQRLGTASTKTRGEVAYSTRKIYQQKGTGRARHGGRGAPIFVKGGVAHGPNPKDYELKLPKAMKKAAFVAALSAQKKDNAISVVAGIESIGPKTKEAARMLEAMGMTSKKRGVLFVLPQDIISVQKPLRNLAGLEITTARRVSTYDVISHKHIILTKEAIGVLEKRVS